MNKEKFFVILRAFFPPLALALFPILFLFAHNRAELLFHELWLPLGVAFLSALIFFLAAFVITWHLVRASVLASLLVAVFWYYGLFYEALYPILVDKSLWGQALWRQRTLFSVWMILWPGLMLLSLKLKPRFFEGVQRPIFLSLFLLLLIPIGNIAHYEFFNREDPALYQKESMVVPATTEESILPDIYYIIPDGYASSNVLSEFFGYDNKEFLEYLEATGFDIVENSTSNYFSTRFSLSSTLNMEYISSESSFGHTRQLAEHNKAVQFLKEQGYTFVFVGSGSVVLSGEEADIRFLKNDFYRVVQRTTAFAPFMNPRNDILNAFSHITEATEVKGPKFVIIHVLVPHVPYVFGEQGEDIGIERGIKESPRDMELYLNQLKFTNLKLQESIDTILQSSDRGASIIILQSDHGVFVPKEWVADEEERFDLRLQNFAAYYLPRSQTGFLKEDITLPSEMSAVNTFRFIFDLYFGTDFGFLEDRYWSFGASS